MKNLKLCLKPLRLASVMAFFSPCFMGALLAQECKKEDNFFGENDKAKFSMKVIENPKPEGELGLESIIIEKKVWFDGIVPAWSPDPYIVGWFKDGDGLNSNDLVKLWDMDMNEIALYNYMIKDDPFTSQVNEGNLYTVPVQEGGVKITVNGTSFKFDPSAGDPGIHPSEKLPEGFMEIEIIQPNGIDHNRVTQSIIRLIFTGGKDEDGNNKGICAYKVDINDEIRAQIYFCTGEGPDGTDVNYDLFNEVPLAKPIRLNCDKVQACIGPRLSSTTCGGSISPSDNFVINLPQIPDYYEVELIIEGNGMSQGSNIGYVSVPACSTCTTTTANVSTSNFYLWDGYWAAYPRVRASGSSEWERGPACWFYYNSSGARQVRGSNGESQQITSRIYPNPSDESGFNIELSGLQETSNTILIKIYDLLGKEVYSMRQNTGGVNQIIHLNEKDSLEVGVYLVSLVVNGKTFNQKIQVK